MAPSHLLFQVNIMVTLIILYPLTKPNNSDFARLTIKMMKLAFFLSLIPLLVYSAQKTETSLGQTPWINSLPTSINLSLFYDACTVSFVPVALFVTWNILEYSTWYMAADPNKNRFIKYLLIFLTAMITLATAGNFYVFFIGWEGVGLMSFLLIGWYHGRNNAFAAATQAVLYNRLGDIGFLTALCWLLKKAPMIEWASALSTNPPTFLLLALIISAATKSAQFLFHPWLASAMEGPTPVSALLHSSTMVVAGIFLLIRVFPLLANNQVAMTSCLCLGALTTLYAAMLAISQNDIKKIIAYSTSSQLGLMMVAIGIGQPHLALFHICTHAFFKAMLFLCSGIIIHSINDEQDIRKMGGLQYALPVTTTCFSIGTLALLGTPFLAGFYSKDAIIEAANISTINSMALALTLIATAFSAVYSLRLVFYISLFFPRINPIIKFSELDIPPLHSITRLAAGSVVAGLLIFHLTFPHSPTIHTLPIYIKMAAILLTAMGFVTAYDLAKMNWHPLPPSHAKFKLYDPLHYNSVMQRPAISSTLNAGGQIATHLLDAILVKKFTPELMKSINLPPVQQIHMSQSGMIKAYLSVLFITTAFVILMLCIPLPL
uniref:NADH-ubiquinone oxidoreductase chain 5 n=1 Tax=Boophis madagascariensis TaxID=127644 RepID=Q2HWL4_9NEOB|nr:NADH dehydrogenase subunit 5 [Boophis madagascariensis]